MRTLSQYDLTGIQPFLFGARRLRANLGASWIVHTALAVDGWLGEAAGGAGSTVLWSGGGNAVVDSPDEATARQVATTLALRMVVEAPGLGVVCAHRTWAGDYPMTARALRDDLEVAKATRPGGALFDGGGVCEPCRDTAEAALARDGEGSPVGASIYAREGARHHAEDRLKRAFVLPTGLVWSDDIDELGRTTGEESALGVIHLDGNGMGRKFAEASGRGLEDVRYLSRHVEAAGRATLVAGLRWVADRASTDSIGFGLAKREGGKAHVFPVRPVVFGGDDLTLLCDGRIALDLAAAMLNAWHAESKFHACAGVAIVRPHFPFYRAVEHAHALCKEAKHWRKENLTDDTSLLHWSLHRAGGVTEERVAHTARPYVVVGAPPRGKTWRSWAWFRHDCLRALHESLDRMAGKGAK